LRALAGQLADLSGWMGAFSARLHTANGPADLAPLSFHEDGHFDWVLDFSATPSIPAATPPLGYYTLAPDDFPALKRTLLEIADRLRSGFEKPRYFQLDPLMCAHRRQSVEGCDACRQVCATGAITADKESIRIEPYLCQGCGSCALVCPAGAVRYAHPRPGLSLVRLKAMLSAWRTTGSEPAGLWITGEAANDAPPGWLPYPVAEPASLGLEFWLAALAFGLNHVVIAPHTIPEQTFTAMQAQITLAQALLSGLGLRQRIAWAGEPIPTTDLPAYPGADLPVTDDKRTLLFAAIDALIARAGTLTASIALPAGPSGEVRIDPAKCTLCAACVRICPVDALGLPGTTRQLAFTEERCLQCGLCVNVCPEKAVSLNSRLLTSRAARQTPRVVAEAEMFACAGCGLPFASRAMLERARAMMAGHPMFQGEQARLMELCPDCRQRAMAGVPL
jgi:ferredoxin